MALPIIEKFGPPQYGRMKGYEGFCVHTPENGDITVEGAIATAVWQAGPKNTSGGSYHGLLGYDSDLGTPADWRAWVLVKTVPFNKIAGGISTRRDSIWQPSRFPVLQLLSDAAYNDPNAYLHQISVSGNASWWSNKLSTGAGRAEYRGMLIALARWIRRLERSYNYDSVLSQHRYWQTNRTDMDGLELMDWVMEEYEKLIVQPPPPPSTEELKARIADLESDLADAQELILRVRNRLTRQLNDKDAEFAAVIAAAERGKAI